ncbi:MAG: hypothetical protein E3J21_20605 [Anaerolineales bacterium]|nr:MAG: hypothetical protein E3J21_20605 [Anaerolineales bacterium]
MRETIASIFAERNVIVCASPYNLRDVLDIVDGIDSLRSLRMTFRRKYGCSSRRSQTRIAAEEEDVQTIT